MKNLTALKIFFFIFFLLSFSLISPTWNKINASNVIFQDNFDDDPTGSFPNKWEILPFTNLCPDEWKVDGGVLKISITNFSSCSTNIIPKNSEWAIPIKNYIFEVDMILMSGTDHNVVYRTDPLVGLGYELHFQSPTNLVASFPGNYFNIPGDYSLGKLYHVKTVVHDNNIQIFINGNLIKDYTSPTEAPAGKIALRASVGGDPSSETYFDNIVVTSLDDSTPVPLTVPYFSQNDPLWGTTEYDHASGKLSNPTMDRWGCVVTSVAMILKYHNINEFANGTPIDPGTLNEWLKNNKGYLTGYSNIDGFYSYFNLPVIGKLTKQLFDAGKSNIKLMHKRAYPSNETTTLLNDDLSLRKFPDILGVNNSQTSSHFVVAKGISGNTYSINDPEWNYPTLSSFNNNYTQVDRYIPSNTNLSYLVAVVNPSVELLVTNPQNNKTGKYFDNGTLQSANEINNASYSFQPPISNPNNGELENLGTGVNEFLLPEPENDKYTIKLSSKKSGFYEINIASFEEEGNNALNKIRGVISSNNDEIIEIDYSQNQTSEIKRFVSFQTLINDINEAKNLKLIKPWIADSLIKLAKRSQKNAEKGRKQIAKIELNIFENIIKSIRKSPLIKEDAYQILLYDVRYLKGHL